MKVLAGDWKEGTPVLIANSELHFAVGIFKSDKLPMNQICQFDIVTEDNRFSILGKVGWGAAGALALGPIGLLIGAVGGGRRQARVLSIVFDDGRKALVKGNAKDAEKITAATYARLSSPPQPVG
ncbi:hypothetical protein [Hyphomicrobium sp. DY-1]|uniref:hypothetical protein n=1 Tax=Hyphomicrobium sp. DY-1 TaxID=3075650 RepID=UPI0039C15907